jgi:hypothetical protein
LNRFSREIGANEELISLIIISLEDWDNKMQIECAQSFLAPLKNNVSRHSTFSIPILVAQQGQYVEAPQTFDSVSDERAPGKRNS